MVFLCTEISEDTHSSNHTYTDTIRGRKKRRKTGGDKHKHNPHLLKMRGQVSDSAVHASRFPSDRTLFGLLCRSPALSAQDSSKEKTKRESVKTVSFSSGPQFRQHQRGQEAKPWVLKSSERCGRGQGAMAVIYRLSCLCSVHLSVVIHTFTVNSSGSLISPCEELL